MGFSELTGTAWFLIYCAFTMFFVIGIMIGLEAEEHPDQT